MISDIDRPQSTRHGDTWRLKAASPMTPAGQRHPREVPPPAAHRRGHRSRVRVCGAGVITGAGTTTSVLVEGASTTTAQLDSPIWTTGRTLRHTTGAGSPDRARDN